MQKKILLLSNKTQEFFDDKLASKHQNLHFKKKKENVCINCRRQHAGDSIKHVVEKGERRKIIRLIYDYKHKLSFIMLFSVLSSPSTVLFFVIVRDL